MMKEKTKKKVASVFGSAKILLGYLPGLVVVFLFWLGRRLGRIEVLYEERLPATIENTEVLYNHPSVADHWFIAALLAKFWLRHPLTQSPLIAADKKLFYNSKKWLLRIFRFAMLPIEREEGKRDATAVLEMRETSRPLLMCPEGKRTFRAKGWIYCSGGTNENGGRIGPFKAGAGNLVQKRGLTVLPIAIVGSHKVVPNDENRLWTRFNFFGKVTLVVGTPMRFSPDQTKWDVTQLIQVRILELIAEAIKPQS